MNIYDIARRAGVSIATVSRVLNSSPHVRPLTREKVLKVMEGAGYVPNAFARGLGLNTMKTIGLVCPNAADPYLARALDELERAFRERSYNCLFTCTGRELDDRRMGVAALAARQVDGMVLMGSTFVEETEADNAYIRAAAEKMPVLVLNGAYRLPNVYCVACDDKRAMREAAALLIARGKKRILYLYHAVTYSGRRKLSGYRTALEEHGIPGDEALMLRLPPEECTVQGVKSRLEALQKSGLAFDAVLASEDLLAIGALKYARAGGLSIPEDLAVIGYNNSDACLMSDPELTSVDNRLKAICEQCAVTMMGVLSGQTMPEITMFTAGIVERLST